MAVIFFIVTCIFKIHLPPSSQLQGFVITELESAEI